MYLGVGWGTDRNSTCFCSRASHRRPAQLHVYIARQTGAARHVQTRATRHVQARARYAHTKGFVLTFKFVLQDRQHRKALATRGTKARAHRRHFVEAPQQWRLTCSFRCRLSSSMVPAAGVHRNALQFSDPERRALISTRTALKRQTVVTLVKPRSADPLQTLWHWQSALWPGLVTGHITLLAGAAPLTWSSFVCLFPVCLFVCTSNSSCLTANPPEKLRMHTSGAQYWGNREAPGTNQTALSQLTQETDHVCL